MSVETTALRARTKRYGLLNDLYIQMSKLRIASLNVASIYEDADERDETMYQRVIDMVDATTRKCEQLEGFLLKEKDTLTRLMSSEDCERSK